MLNLNLWNDIIIYGATVSLVSFFLVLVLTPRLIKLLIVKGQVVQDYHKSDRPSVPRPAGPAMAIGIGIAEIALYLFTGDARVLAILLTSMIAFVIGLSRRQESHARMVQTCCIDCGCSPIDSNGCS